MASASLCSPSRRARILMLHGWTQNASIFSEKSGSFKKKLRDVADLVFAEAPHFVAVDAAPGRENARAWWSIEDVPAPDESDEVSSPVVDDPSRREEVFRRRFVGWDESRLYLARLWETNGPFDGIVGFSQGSVVVHQLLSEVQGWADGWLAPPAGCAPIADSPPRFGILVCGFPSALAAAPPVSSTVAVVDRRAMLRFPTLHCIATGDRIVPPALQSELAAAFSAPVVLELDKGHAMPQRAAELAGIVAFVRERMAEQGTVT